MRVCVPLDCTRSMTIQLFFPQRADLDNSMTLIIHNKVESVCLLTEREVWFKVGGGSFPSSKRLWRPLAFSHFFQIFGSSYYPHYSFLLGRHHHHCYQSTEKQLLRPHDHWKTTIYSLSSVNANTTTHLPDFQYYYNTIRITRALLHYHYYTWTDTILTTDIITLIIFDHSLSGFHHKYAKEEEGFLSPWKTKNKVYHMLSMSPWKIKA